MAEKKTAPEFIQIDDGSRRVPIRNTQGEEIGVFVFRPTDIGIIKRYNDMVQTFDQITAPLENLPDDADIFDPQFSGYLDEATQRMYDAVNGLLDAPDAAKAFFGSMHPFSPVNGEFYATQVLERLGAYIGSQFDRETAAFSANAKKYAKKAGTGAK